MDGLSVSCRIIFAVAVPGDIVAHCCSHGIRILMFYTNCKASDSSDIRALRAAFLAALTSTMKASARLPSPASACMLVISALSSTCVVGSPASTPSRCARSSSSCSLVQLCTPPCSGNLQGLSVRTSMQAAGVPVA